MLVGSDGVLWDAAGVPWVVELEDGPVEDGGLGDGLEPADAPEPARCAGSHLDDKGAYATMQAANRRRRPR